MTRKEGLLNEILAFHGIGQWNEYKTIKAHVKMGGITWSIKGHEGATADIHFTGNYHAQQAEWHGLFGQLNSEFNPDRVALLDEKGAVIEELLHPFDTFEGHKVETPWTRTQLVYFSSYATWNYLTMPFNFLLPGIIVNEIDPWQQDGETWRMLEVIYPDHIATHSKRQLYYFSQDGKLRRHDYWPRVLGNSSATQIIEDYRDFSGIKIGTKRRIYILNDNDNSYQPEPVLVTIDVIDVHFE
jgi:hypothetical protein